MNVLELKIPNLKDRGEDVIELFYHFFNQRIGLEKCDIVIPKSVVNLLTKYSWPGNIRELQNVCERFCLFIRNSYRDDERFLKKLLVQSIREDRFLEDIIKSTGYNTFTDIENTEDRKELLRQLIDIFPLTNDQLAQKLGISRTTLWRLKIDINYKMFHNSAV